MTTENFDFIDPFENIKKLIEELTKSALSASSNISSITELTQRDFDKRYSQINRNMQAISKTMSIVEKNLSAFQENQLKITRSAEIIAKNQSNLIDSIAKASSILSRMNTEYVTRIATLNINESFRCIKDLQTFLPTATVILENLEIENDNEIVEEESGKTDTLISVESKKINAKNFKTYVDYVSLIVSILQLLFGIVFSSTPEVNINITNDYSTKYYVNEVNNFYMNEENFSAESYNANGYRFVAEKEVMPRIKPDCTSTVVDKLSLGKMVQIVDKHKKWVQIRWKNGDDTFSYGWIQNYKLSDFKE